MALAFILEAVRKDDDSVGVSAPFPHQFGARFEDDTRIEGSTAFLYPFAKVFRWRFIA
jgi:hypothetical protein